MTWQIDVTADSPEEAARLSLEMHRDADSTATLFMVREKLTGARCIVDLTPVVDDPEAPAPQWPARTIYEELSVDED